MVCIYLFFSLVFCSKCYLFYRTEWISDQTTKTWLLWIFRCDRILWYGRGLNQLSYVRGESRFSDHRPVCSLFSAEVESVNRSRIKKSMSCSSARIEVEELLPPPYSHGYTHLDFYWKKIQFIRGWHSLCSILLNTTECRTKCKVIS